MRPILFEIGNTIIDSYSFFYILAWLTGIAIFLWEAKKRQWSIESTLLLVGSCGVGAVLGAAGFEVFFIDPEILHNKVGFFDFSGRTVIGGIAGGFLAVEFTKKRIGFKQRTGDAFAFAIPIGHSIGRLGCLLGGCCFGNPTTLPWGISYPIGSLPYLIYEQAGLLTHDLLGTTPVHPTPVYEILANMLIIGILFFTRSSLHKNGSLFRLYLVLYATFRFLIEFMRADTLTLTFVPLKPVQLVLLLIIAYFAWGLYKVEKDEIGA